MLNERGVRETEGLSLYIFVLGFGRE